MAQPERAELFIPPLALCTDNAAMAGIAFPKLAAGQVAELDVDVIAGLVRPKRTGSVHASSDPGHPGPGN